MKAKQKDIAAAQTEVIRIPKIQRMASTGHPFYFELPRSTRLKTFGLLQFRVLGLGFFQYGDVRVGIFPEVDEIFIGGKGPDAGGGGIRRFQVI